MADIRMLKKNWLRDARDANNGSTDKHTLLTWLCLQRKELSPEVTGGDWAVTQQGRSTRNTTATKNVTGHDSLAALLAVIEDLEAQLGLGDSSSTGALLGFEIHGIHP